MRAAGRRYRGIAVHIAARILGLAGAGEILVSSTVRDLVVGSGTGFQDRGDVQLRGCRAPGGSWRSIATVRGPERQKRSCLGAHAWSEAHDA